MRQYLFIPWEPMDSEIFALKFSDPVIHEFIRRARATRERCTLFEFAPGERRGLRMLYAVRDGEIFDGAGVRISNLTLEDFP